MLKFMYTHAVDNDDTLKGVTSVTQLAHIYTIADQFDVAPLRDLAMTRLSERLHFENNSDPQITDGLEAMKIIYPVSIRNISLYSLIFIMH